MKLQVQILNVFVKDLKSRCFNRPSPGFPCLPGMGPELLPSDIVYNFIFPCQKLYLYLTNQLTPTKDVNYHTIINASGNADLGPDT